VKIGVHRTGAEPADVRDYVVPMLKYDIKFMLPYIPARICERLEIYATSHVVLHDVYYEHIYIFIRHQRQQLKIQNRKKLN